MKIYVHAEWNQYTKSVVYRGVSQTMIGLWGHVIQEVEIEHEQCSDQAAIDAKVLEFKAQQQTIRAEAERKCQEIEGQIQSMLALPAAAL